MSESLNISYEHSEEAATVSTAGKSSEKRGSPGAVVPKMEPRDSADYKQKAKKSKKQKADESDFDPANMTEEEDPSIPEDEDASFVSFKGSKGKRGRGGYAHHYARVPSRPYAAVQNYESEDDVGYGRLPRQRYSRACKNPQARPILDIDIPSSSSPEEFDETIHVMSKAYKLQLEAKRAKEMAAQRAASSTIGYANNINSASGAVKEEIAGDVKQEPIDTQHDSDKVKLEPESNNN